MKKSLTSLKVIIRLFRDSWTLTVNTQFPGDPRVTVIAQSDQGLMEVR